MDAHKRVLFAENIIDYSFIVFAFSCVVSSISVTQIAFAVGALAWLYTVFMKNGWERLHLPLGIAFALFTLASVLSMLFSINPSKSILFLRKLIQIVIFFLFLNNLKSSDQIKRLLNIVFIAVGLNAALACYQTFEMGLSLFTRAEGTLSTYVTFAALMMVNSLMILSYIFFDFHWKRDWWLLIVLMLTVTGLGLSLTRSTWVGLFVGIFILLFLKNKKFFILIPVIAGALLFVAPDQVSHRAKSIFDPTDPTRVSRINMWKTGINIFKDYPLTGTGYYTLSQVSEYYKVSPDQERVKGLHSNFFQIITDAGILGISSWTLIWISFFIKGRLIYKRIAAIDPFFKAVTIGSVTSVAAFLVTGFFEGNFYDSEVIMLIYFLMSIPFALSLAKLGYIPGMKRAKVAPGPAST